MTKIVLENLGSIQNDPTAVDKINDNSAVIVNAFDNTLSRDGTSPNNMNANLDMNSNRILNLPRPMYDNEPARLKDIGNAYQYAQDAKQSAEEAAQSAVEADASATASANSAAASATSATNSANSATASANSATAAAGSATAASGSATAAGTSATNAANSASAASGSASSANTSAINAGNSATAAAGSATAASTSATNASNSATAAAGSATSAANSLASFQSEYLGPLVSDPVGTYPSGTLYWNTTSNVLKIYNGTSWVAYTASSVSSVFGRTGAVVAATNDYNFNQLAGNIATTQMNSGTGASSSTYWRGDGTWSSPAGGVTSVFGRSGAVTAQSGDYSYSQISSTPPLRTVLTANRTYYVSTTGSDSNDGLTALTPFLTIQKAIDTVIGTLDFYGFTVTIQLADGTYTAGGTVVPGVGIAGVSRFVIKGNTSTPGNVIVSTTAASCFYALSGGVFTLQDMELRTTTSGRGIESSDGSYVEFQNIRFGANADSHMITLTSGRIKAVGAYNIVAGASRHAYVNSGTIRNSNMAVTLTGTPAFSICYAQVERTGLFDSFNITYTGTATGVRFALASGGTIFTNGGGTTILPGNAPGTGTINSGGFYV